MPIASHSPLGLTLSKLRGLQCTQSSFLRIANGRGVQLSVGSFNEACNDIRPLARSIEERLLDIAGEMQELNQAIRDAGFDISVDWTKSETIVRALVTRLLAKCDPTPGTEFEQEGQKATAAVLIGASLK